jgi:anti-anti-sigma factor
MAGLGVGSTADMTFAVAEDVDRTLTVTLSGELDITNVDALASGVAPALEHDPARLVLDVHDLRFADSSAIALWVGWSSKFEEIELRDPTPLLRKVIETMGLAQALHLMP